MVRSRFFPVVITGLILALLVGGGAVAAKMITGKQIKNGSVSTKDVKNNNLKSKDLKNGGVSSKDIKNKTVDTEDLAGQSVTAGKIAPGAIEFPTSLWGPVIRNQTGGAESNVQAGPEGALGDGSLRLFVCGVAGPCSLRQLVRLCRGSARGLRDRELLHIQGDRRAAALVAV